MATENAECERRGYTTRELSHVGSSARAQASVAMGVAVATQLVHMRACYASSLKFTPTYLTMDESKRKALRQCHPDLRTRIRVSDFLPSLHFHAGGFLNHVENDCIKNKKGHVKQVDELIDILLTKEGKDFDYFCTVLEKEGYKVWSDKLKDAAGLGKRQQLGCM